MSSLSSQSCKSRPVDRAWRTCRITLRACDDARVPARICMRTHLHAHVRVHVRVRACVHVHAEMPAHPPTHSRAHMQMTSTNARTLLQTSPLSSACWVKWGGSAAWMPSSAIHKRKASVLGSIPMYIAYSSTCFGSVGVGGGGCRLRVEIGEWVRNAHVSARRHEL